MMAIIRGTNNDDCLNGTSQDDSILGKNGNDVIRGGGGDDTLFGGRGSDTFVFNDQSGNDEIKDFDIAEDTIVLNWTGLDNTNQLNIVEGPGNSVVVSFGGDSITFQGLSVNDVASINFIIDPEMVQLGDSTVDPASAVYTDAGDGTSQIITGDSTATEGLTDTDTFIFGDCFGNDTITDFQINDVDLIGVIPGDLLDLSAFGLFRTNLGNAGQTLEQFLAGGGITFTPTGIDGDGDGQLDDTLLTFDDGNTLSLLGVDEEDLVVVVECNLTTPGGDAPGCL